MDSDVTRDLRVIVKYALDSYSFLEGDNFSRVVFYVTRLIHAP